MIFEFISEGQKEYQMREREELDFKEKTGTLGGQGGQVAGGSSVEGDWWAMKVERKAQAESMERIWSLS